METFKRKINTFAMGLCMALMVFGSTTTYAVDGVGANEPDIFELDGNPQSNDTTTYLGFPQDWEDLWLDCGVDPDEDGVVPPAADGSEADGKCGESVAFTGIIPDPFPLTTFWKGGSKDDLDIPNWHWKDGNTPDKDNIINAFAVAYENDVNVCISTLSAVFDGAVLIGGDEEPCTGAVPVGDTTAGPGAGQTLLHAEGDLMVYFGMDIFDNEGDKFGGFWFFEQLVAPIGEGGTSTANFSGTQDIGNILVSVNFPQANDGVPEVQIMEWNPGLEDIADNLHLIAEMEFAQCDGTGGKLFCAITNNPNETGAPVPTIWPYADKDGFAVTPPDPYPHESFISGGINLTRVLGGAAKCISSFQAQTRASRSIDSKLWDFVGGEFDVCSSDIMTEIHAEGDHATDIQHPTPLTQQIGLKFHDEATVTGAGPGITTDPTGLVTFILYDSGTCVAGTGDENVLDTRVKELIGGAPGDATATVETISANGVGGSGASTEYDSAVLGPGSYSIGTTYEGDANFPATAEEFCERIDISKYNSKIKTEIHDVSNDGTGAAFDIQGGSVNIGLTIHDYALVEEKDGIAGAPAPTGDVTFEIYDNTSCDGTKLGAFGGISWDQVITLVAGAAKTANFIPPQGTLGIKASYPGDTFYNASTDVICESLTVNKLDPNIDTVVIVRDRARVTGSGAAPTGDVEFTTYSVADCVPGAADINVVGTVTRSLSGSPTATAEQSAVQEIVLGPAADVVSYKAEYLGNSIYNGATAACENVNLTITP